MPEVTSGTLEIPAARRGLVPLDGACSPLNRAANVAAVTGRLFTLCAVAAALVATGVCDAGSRAASAQRGPVLLAFAGDVHFEGAVRATLMSRSGEVLGAISPVLKQADIAAVNLETAVTTRGAAQPKQYVFRAPPSAFAALRNGGVDVATMANNHGMDYGVEGLRDSLAAARRAHFHVIGIGLDDAQAYRPYRATIRGERIAIIAATQVLDDNLIASWTAGPHKPGLASAKDVPRLVEAVRSARATADTVVVFVHWGVELAGCPTARQRRLARELVAAGADVVVGSHAHRLLGGGKLGRTFVDYGLGNFAWYSSASGVTAESGVVLVSVTGRHVNGYRFAPARIVNGSPYPLSGSERASAIRSWRSLRSCAGLKR
jgi:poly-gamma-glutamate capsule biosynthesis protein CapA/YwtB (metallophosphatase superfamily)